MKVVIKIEGGVCQAVYSDNPDLEVEVYDLDLPDFPTKHELDESDAREQQYRVTIKDMNRVW